MSISSVTDRIAQIEAQISQLQGIQPSGADAAAAFAEELGRASTASLGGLSATAVGDGLGVPVTAGSTLESTAGSTAPTTSQRAVVDEAKKYLGLPYVWGGTDPAKGMDCSGLVQVVYGNLGYELPRVSADQARAGRPISSMAEAQPGDLIAWDNSGRNSGADHIAIYIGDGKMIEAPRTGLDIRIVDVPTTPDYIRRILPDSTETARGTVAPTGPDGSAGRAALAELAASRTAFDLATRLEAS